MMDSVDYGMPQTEDAENMPTMMQLKLNFNVNQSNEIQNSMRSGVFGGFQESL